MTIQDLQPKAVWDAFYALTQVPRPSHHNEKIQAYLLDWASGRGIEAFRDDTGNIIMRVPATPGYEDRKGVILQGHMDMVPQKNADKVHDFENDPIKTVVCGDWLKADGTTLGADNGLGVALALAAADSKTLKHGPLELLFTYDEEVGMTGARSLKPGILKGEILINLDSEEEGELYVGCAGGLDAAVSGRYLRKDEPEGFECWSLALKGCQGGHSGMDINLCRANANKQMARLLYALLTQSDAKLLDLEGGSLRNAIPREAFATVYVKDPEASRKAIEPVFKTIKAEYAATDPNMQLVFEPYKCAPGEVCDPDECRYVSENTAIRYMQAIMACPDGVDRMSDAIPGLVEASNNLAIVKIFKGKFSVHTLMRGSVDSVKEFIGLKLKSVFELAGCKVSFSGGYSGWAPNAQSPILAVMKDVYKQLFGTDARVMAVHAGLECGILAGAYPDWDMISFGPTLRSPHSPDERCFIPSVQKSWDFLQAVLENI